MDTITILRAAAETIQHQRHALELASAKLDVFEKCAMMAGMHPPERGGEWAAPDIVQELQKCAEELINESMAKVDPGTAVKGSK